MASNHPAVPNVAADGVWRPDATVATIVERDGRFLFVEERVRGRLVINQPAGLFMQNWEEDRSEERRVGKEC